jgi:uncharacterized damage-inducible protein DinB
MLATHLVCWLVWWLHQNLLSLTGASAGRTQQQIPKPRQCSTLCVTKNDYFMKIIISSLSLMLVFTLTSKAQFADSLKEQLLKDWKRSKLYTIDYLKTVPGDKFSFRPQDSTRTFAQQMIHLSQATVSLMQAATEMNIPSVINRHDLENVPSALTKDSVTYFVTLSYDYATQALENFEISKSYQYVKRGKFNETRIAWILKAFEHQAHHRGQTTIYIRLLGLKPPNERLFDNMYE